MRERIYSEAEVLRIFKSSEGSEPPAGTPWRREGHSSVHVNRGKVQLGEDARGQLRRNPNSAKTAFLNFAEQVRAATGLLNSPAGQQVLRRLDEGGLGTFDRIEEDLAAPVRIHFNMTGMSDDTRLIPWHRFVLLVAATRDDIYLHTCYADIVLD